MKIFYIVDTLEHLDENINKITSKFQCEINFFVSADVFVNACKNTLIKNNTISIYANNLNKCVDDYIKKDDFVSTDILVVFASASLSLNTLDKFYNAIPNGYDSIMIGKKKNFLQKAFSFLYNKFIYSIFHYKDNLSSIKIQYLSKNFVEVLRNSHFGYRLLDYNNTLHLELEDKESDKSLKTVFRLKQYNIYNLIVFFAMALIFSLLCIVLPNQFWVYFLFIGLLLVDIIVGAILIFKNIFDSRFRL